MKSSAFVCRGCGEEYDPRDRARGSATQDGHCSLMCALEAADQEGDRDE